MVAHINELREESVMEHCTKTAEYAQKIGDRIGLRETAYLMAYLHDVGKYTKVFEDYIIRAVRGETNTKGPTHSTAGGKLIFDTYADTNGYNRLTATVIAWSIFSHHGLNDMISIDGEYTFENRMLNAKESEYLEACTNFETENTKDLDNLFKQSAIEIKTAVSRLKNIVPDKNRPFTNEQSSFCLGMLARLNLSVLIEADRAKTAEFMTGIIHGDSDNIDNLWDDFISKMDAKLSQFNKENGKSEIAMARMAYSKMCEEAGDRDTGIYQLNMPTGAGKTLASMNFALRHARKYGKERIFYVAPYKSILSQNASVYRDLFQNDEVILEHHSDIIIDDDDDNEKEDIRKYYTQNWHSTIVVTTMVQFLNTLFGGKTQQIRRFQALTNSVIIIDEIQSLPVKTINMFNVAMNFLKEYGTTVVLCSATQPLLSNTPIPISIDGDITGKDADIRKYFKRNEVIDMRKTVTSYETISNLASQLTYNNNSGIIIVNTKMVASKLYNMLKEKLSEDIKLIHISTNMCPEHQKKVINEFKTVLKDGNQRVVCVSTPILEAGVDISAQWVIRSVTGWDNVMQSAGRCNRNGEYDIGYVYLVECEEENINSLTDIKLGKDCSKNALRAFYKDKTTFGNDLMSKEFIEYYYKRYFKEREQEMNYSDKEKNTNIFDMLSLNKNPTAEVKRKGKNVGLLTQAFKEAGKSFEVISQDMQGVVTPFGRGKEIIAELEKITKYDNPTKLLREAQKYSINLYRGKFMEYIKSGIIYKLDNLCVYCLMEGYYDDNIGINKESMLDDLFF